MIQTIFSLTDQPLPIFLRWLLLSLSAVLLLWVYCTLRCYFSSKEKKSLQIIIRQSLIEASLLCIVALAVYFIFFVRATGWQRFVWDEWYWSFARNTYFMLLPEFVTLISVSILFFIQTKNFTKLLNIK